MSQSPLKRSLFGKLVGNKSKALSRSFLGKMSAGANRLLVIESRGFGINAYVVERRGDAITLIEYAHNKIASCNESLAEICEQLTVAGCAIPQKALLVSGAVTAALISLPIDGDKTLSDQQMLELVRWEMEPLFNELIAYWTIGGLLIAKGYLAESQRKQLLVDLGEQKEKLAGRGGRAPARFGELAIRAAYITKEQLDECLRIHEETQLLDPTIDCSWSDKPIATDQQGGLWLCAAMSAPIRQQWVDAFSHNKIFLSGIYSQHHSAVSQLPISENEQLLVILNVGLVTSIVVKNNLVTATKQYRCSDHALTSDEVITLLIEHLNVQLQTDIADESSAIYYSGYHPQINDLITEVMPQLNATWICLDGVLAKDKQTLIVGDAAIVGATNHYFNQYSLQQQSRLIGTPPPPAWYKNTSVQGGLICFSIFAFIAANEGHYYYTEQRVFLEIQQNEIAVEKIDDINEKLNSKNERYIRLKKQKKQLEEKLEVLSVRRQGLNTVLLKRQEFIANLLPLISRSINDQLILKMVEEGSWYHFELSGWASDQLAIDSFNQQLTAELEPWNMQLTNSSSREGRSDFGFDGYQFMMTLEPAGL
ncbi:MULTISPECIES: hypothetical protein [unclassified Moritella]|uniref:hypothetical protein n=1 Tax=unclassified Moritella TaxID=2637987 RepID=UPI001BAAD766|nr:MULTISPECIES: hypothetical protein [unclassified Moritella]QUM84944.1 hypothetical protein HWV02_10780 [Moritella sp. 28]QUM89176.1 hypothetical protein HWV03_10385 [Moritella sp. 36]